MGGGSLTLLLDTHALLWWLTDGGRLARVQRAAIERADASGEPIAIAAITFWEIAKLVERGRLKLTQTVDVLLEAIEEHPSVEVLPLTSRIAVESTRLGRHMTTDPADQLIVATARVHGLRLVTADERIRRAAPVSIV